MNSEAIRAIRAASFTYTRPFQLVDLASEGELHDSDLAIGIDFTRAWMQWSLFKGEWTP